MKNVSQKSKQWYIYGTNLNKTENINMEIEIRRAEGKDAQTFLELSKIFGSETDNLSYGEIGMATTVEKQREYLSSIADSEKDIFLLAFSDGEPVATANYVTFTKKRMAHRGELGICVRKSAWGLGIGSMLLEKLLDFAKVTAKADLVSLEVRSDNQRAISLYRKFGFEKTGCFKGYFKINHELINFDIMEKFFV